MKTQKFPKHFVKSSIQFFMKMQLYIGFAAIVQSCKTWPISTPGKTFWKVFAFNPIKVWPSNPSHKCHLVARISTKYTPFFIAWLDMASPRYQ